MRLIPDSDAVDLASMLRDLLRAECPTTVVRAQRDNPAEPVPETLWRALVDAGCETGLVVYSRGGHGWAERGYLIDSWERSKDWFDRYLRVPAAVA